MKITSLDPKTVEVSGLLELVAANTATIRDAIRAALPETCVQLDIDLSQIGFLDSSGLGALLSLHKTLRARQGAVRLINPTQQVLQILELTRLHRVFEIVKTPS